MLLQSRSNGYALRIGNGREWHDAYFKASSVTVKSGYIQITFLLLEYWKKTRINPFKDKMQSLLFSTFILSIFIR